MWDFLLNGTIFKRIFRISTRSHFTKNNKALDPEPFSGPFFLTDGRNGRQLHGVALALRRSGVHPGARVPHRLQPLLLDVLQLDGDRAAVTCGFPQLKPHPRVLTPGGDGGVDHGALLLCAEVPKAAPAERGHLYATVDVVGVAERRRLAAA